MLPRREQRWKGMSVTVPPNIKAFSQQQDMSRKGNSITGTVPCKASGLLCCVSAQVHRQGHCRHTVGDHTIILLASKVTEKSYSLTCLEYLSNWVVPCFANSEERASACDMLYFPRWNSKCIYGLSIIPVVSIIWVLSNQQSRTLVWCSGIPQASPSTLWCIQYLPGTPSWNCCSAIMDIASYHLCCLLEKKVLGGPIIWPITYYVSKYLGLLERPLVVHSIRRVQSNTEILSIVACSWL